MCKQLIQISHYLAAWAAATAASASPKCRFSVAQGVAILETIGFGPAYGNPDRLPSPSTFDKTHRKWRLRAIATARGHRIGMSHGVAAKLNNVYHKARFTCGGHADHPKVAALHPPIDSILLRELARLNLGNLGPIWRSLAVKRWSKFDSYTYELAIDCIKTVQHPEPAWVIERHWSAMQE